MPLPPPPVLELPPYDAAPPPVAAVVRLPSSTTKDEEADGPIKWTLLAACIFVFLLPSSIASPQRGAGISATNDICPQLTLSAPLAAGPLPPEWPGRSIGKTYTNTTPMTVPMHATPGNTVTHVGLPCFSKSYVEGL
jgi:hypothetical protein